MTSFKQLSKDKDKLARAGDIGRELDEEKVEEDEEEDDEDDDDDEEEDSVESLGKQSEWMRRRRGSNLVLRADS